MKKDLHPQYHQKAHVKCACGNEFTIGSTKEHIEIEACSQCHPFYTGRERGAVRGGRIEKFQSRIQKKEILEKAPKNKVEKQVIRKAKKEEK